MWRIDVQVDEDVVRRAVFEDAIEGLAIHFKLGVCVFFAINDSGDAACITQTFYGAGAFGSARFGLQIKNFCHVGVSWVFAVLGKRGAKLPASPLLSTPDLKE